LILFFIYSAFGLVKHPLQRQYFFELMILSLVSLALIIRIFFRTSPMHHGFCFLILGMISYFVFFFRLAGDYFVWRIKQFPLYLFHAILSWFMIFMIVFQWSISSYLYGQKRLQVHTDKGTFMTYPDDMSVKILSVIDYLRNNVPSGKTISIFPEGASIYFLTGIKPAYRYSNVLPELFYQLGEDKMLASFSKANPDYVVIVQRDTSDHGAASFGKNYAQKLYAWILSNYTVVQQFGPYPFTSPEFGVAVFKRK